MAGIEEMVDDIMDKGKVVGQMELIQALEKWLITKRVAVQHKINEINKELKENNND